MPSPRDLEDLSTETENPDSRNLDRLGSLELVRLMNRQDGNVVAAVAAEAAGIAKAIDRIVETLGSGGRLIYVGAGTSGRLGVLDAVECPPTFNTDPAQILGVIAGGKEALVRSVEGAEDSEAQGRADLVALSLAAKDVLVGIAASGRTPYVLGAVALAREKGATSIGISCNTGSPLSKAADLAITPVVGPEVLTGSTRLKAGTATKMVLNMLSTGAMVGLGKTHGNLMVDVQASNEKLRIRALSLVCRLTGLESEASAELLQRCGGRVKESVLVHRRGITPPQATKLLENHGGRLSKALGESES